MLFVLGGLGCWDGADGLKIAQALNLEDTSAINHQSSESQEHSFDPSTPVKRQCPNNAWGLPNHEVLADFGLGHQVVGRGCYGIVDVKLERAVHPRRPGFQSKVKPHPQPTNLTRPAKSLSL